MKGVSHFRREMMEAEALLPDSTTTAAAAVVNLAAAVPSQSQTTTTTMTTIGMDVDAAFPDLFLSNEQVDRWLGEIVFPRLRESRLPNPSGRGGVSSRNLGPTF